MDQVGTDTSLVLTIKLIQDSVRQLHLLPVLIPIRRNSRQPYALSIVEVMDQIIFKIVHIYTFDI